MTVSIRAATHTSRLFNPFRAYRVLVDRCSPLDIVFRIISLT